MKQNGLLILVTAICVCVLLVGCGISKERYNTLLKEKQDLQASYAKLVGEKTALKAALDKATVEKTAIKSDFDKLQGEKNALRKEYDTLLDEKVRSGAALDAALADKKAMEDRISALQNAAQTPSPAPAAGKK